MIITSLCAGDQAITISAPKIDITDNFITVKDSDEKKEQTFVEKLRSDVSYLIVQDHHNKNTVSFRGIRPRATNMIEDLIPVYRTTGGNIDFYYNYNMYKMSSNMLITPSSLGVSSMGSDIELSSKTPRDTYEGHVSSTVSQSDEQQKLYVGTKQKDYALQFNLNRYDQDSFTLSDDFSTTAEQPSKDRLNSDNNLISYEIKGSYYLNGTDSLALKYKDSKSDFGIAPNVYDNSEGYQRMNKKDLESLYGYYDHIENDFEANVRLYYDRYEDIYDFYTDKSFQTLLFPSSLYDDERIGIIGKTKFKKDRDELSFVLKYQRDEHVWKRDGSSYVPTFQYRNLSGSVIGKKVYDNLTITGAITYKDFKPVKVDYDGDPAYTQNEKGVETQTVDYQAGMHYLQATNLYYVSHSKTTRMPFMAEMFAFFPHNAVNTGLKAESSHNTEIGYKKFLDYGLYSVSAFYYDIEDKIEYNNNAFVNIDSAVHKGGEFRYENNYFNTHNVTLGYAYTIAKDGSGRDLALVPGHKLVIEDKIDISQRYSANIQYLYIGKRKDETNSNIKTLPSYSVTNVYISGAFSKDFDLTVGIKNLFDKNYQSAYGYPSEGRNIYGRVSWKF